MICINCKQELSKTFFNNNFKCKNDQCFIVNILYNGDNFDKYFTNKDIINISYMSNGERIFIKINEKDTYENIESYKDLLNEIKSRILLE